MLQKYILEFVSICEFIAEKAPEKVCNSYIYVEPDILRKMLNKNKFAECDTKLRIWRNLGWLQCEPERFTKSITALGRRLRVFVLNRFVYEQLQELLSVGEEAGAGEPISVDKSPMSDDAAS